MSVLEVIILRGLPASGKTTWAREHQSIHPSFARVNRDDLRAMMYRVWSEANEAHVLKARDVIVVQLLIGGQNVIIDDTNLTAYSVERIRSLIEALPFQVGIREVRFTTRIEECIRRDNLRTASVGAERIKEIAEKAEITE
jgi:predicted kinase